MGHRLPGPETGFLTANGRYYTLISEIEPVDREGSGRGGKLLPAEQTEYIEVGFDLV